MYIQDEIANAWPTFCPALPDGSPTIAPRTNEPTLIPSKSPTLKPSAMSIPIPTPAPEPSLSPVAAAKSGKSKSTKSSASKSSKVGPHHTSKSKSSKAIPIDTTIIQPENEEQGTSSSTVGEANPPTATSLIPITSSPTVEANPPTATSLIPITSSPTNDVSILNPPTPAEETESPTPAPTGKSGKSKSGKGTNGSKSEKMLPSSAKSKKGDTKSSKLMAAVSHLAAISSKLHHFIYYNFDSNLLISCILLRVSNNFNILTENR